MAKGKTINLDRETKDRLEDIMIKERIFNASQVIRKAVKEYHGNMENNTSGNKQNASSVKKQKADS